MDAVSLLKRLTTYKLVLAVFCLFCAYPVLSGILYKIQHHSWMLMDIDAVICGAHDMAVGVSPYHLHPTCKGLKPATFVYAPQIAKLFMPFVTHFGNVGARTLFIWLMLIPATALLLWFALIKPFPGIDVRMRWLAFGALTAMTFVCANVAIVMHALVLASLVFFPRRRWVFTLAVLACICIKPTFLAYFILFLFDDLPLWRRLLAFGWRCLAGVGVAGLMLVTAGHYADRWQKTLHTVALTRQTGMGWFELTDLYWNIPSASPAGIILALAFMSIMLTCGLAMAQWGSLDEDERLVLGVGLAPLMTPRLLDYDMVLIVPYAALLIAIAYRVGGRTFRFSISWLFTLALVFGILTDILNIKWYHRTPMGMLLFGLITLFVGIRTVAHRFGQPKLI